MNKEPSSAETAHSDSNDSQANLPLVGDILRDKRESLGISQKDIADRLRLRVAIVQGIESNDFQVGQVHTFTRGYIRSYARAVGIDDKTILELFDKSEATQVPEQSMQSFSQQTTKQKHDKNIMKLTWGIFTVVLGISVVWWWQSEQKADSIVSDSSEVTQTIDEQGAESPVDIQQLPASQDSVEQQASVNVNEAQPTVTEETAQPAVEQQVQTKLVKSDDKPISSTVEKSPTIAMTFKADCWIQVQDVQGNTLWTGVKTKGQQLELEGQGPFKFVLGAPEAVSLSISGESIDLSRYTAGKVARFTAE
ncbi:hypothetical protein A9264_00185 [Vibrio sp. UCD-FRSSP16_10]|uniref:RodZ domain-containing protein n=1 Tax=unclassified Vibrio TaxID=2614977 RepID=UPI0007FCBEFA|nr:MULTISPECIES: RodZ domain-containing protein [unclassified Vibrio]OBT17234.1 hypothetical protein A9260_01635 [Vibrio sp. UCD-FRSSP16_30]OBT23003.1 hypothetical protein A9264_00185 [Vibrio sp. UCD-FRSSP16_10]